MLETCRTHGLPTALPSGWYKVPQSVSLGGGSTVTQTQGIPTAPEARSVTHWTRARQGSLLSAPHPPTDRSVWFCL